MTPLLRTLLAGGAVVAALVAAGSASAGCWATVGLAPPPAGLAAGTVWTAEITVLQHGRNPLPDARDATPRVAIVRESTGEEQTFTAIATDPAKGLYQAEVVFPSPGTWTYTVFDGFTSWNGEPAPCEQAHTFAPVTIVDPSAGSAAGGSFPLWPVTGGLVAVLVAVGALVVFVRRGNSRAPASV